MRATLFGLMSLGFFFVVGCGDDTEATSGNAPTGGTGNGSSSGGAGAGATGPGGQGNGGEGGGGGGNPGLPCGEGPITAACDCGGAAHATGSCCSEQWFDPYYDTLITGCPDPSAFRYVDPAHAAASDGGPGTADEPWASIEHGVATTSGGQVLVVRAGTYHVECTGERYDPALNPQSGSAGAPVILKADGEVIIEPAVVETGTAQGGSPSTIVLASSASSVDNAYTDHHVRIVAGTGAGQARQILRDIESNAVISYEGATRTAWIGLNPAGMGNWQTPPDATSQYELVRNGPLVGTLSRQHVVWDGFHVRERDNYHPDTGPIVVWDSENVVLLNGNFEGMTEHLYDNHNIVRFEGSSSSTLRNSRLHGIGFPEDHGPNNPQNHAAIMIYSSQDLVIEHNEIFDAYTGVFPKGGNGGHVIRYNVVHDCAKAFRFSYHADLRVHQNVVYDCVEGFQFAENNADLWVFNNVVHESGSGYYNWFPIAGVTAFNNIFFEVGSPALFEGGVGTMSSNRNVFFGFASFEPGGSLTGWQALGYDADSIQGDPQFVDAPARDYRLGTRSPALTVGRDDGDLDGDGNTTETIPAGAYVTGDEIIGRFAEP